MKTWVNDHMIVAGPKRVDEPVVGDRYWVSTPKMEPVESMLMAMDSEWVTVWMSSGGELRARRPEVSFYRNKPR